MDKSGRWVQFCLVLVLSTVLIACRRVPSQFETRSPTVQPTVQPTAQPTVPPTPRPTPVPKVTNIPQPTAAPSALTLWAVLPETQRTAFEKLIAEVSQGI